MLNLGSGLLTPLVGSTLFVGCAFVKPQHGKELVFCTFLGLRLRIA